MHEQYLLLFISARKKKKGLLKRTLSTLLDSHECGVHVLRFQVFFFLSVNSNITRFYYAMDKKYCSCTVYGFHDTIHLFKNYFVTVFFSFQLCPNGPLMNFTLFHVYPKKEKKKNLLCSNKWFY